ncbi:hypothetical protein COU00_01240 [Candidatus Falkowbacteria bacterium CG10_big_fil_rev_8_21_14_0_10_43_11]|uniref:Uncharacterized protein n=1 Tax=Candidatus Falkowbacteria bacterium CG10_big_fil_rev_8_21_14_0_10_43_11 TaxID=1974568 RepID=A0A2M6WMQ9_9BACT|nr:MAG: hypothetical protein COU00_01240 [Candidatus Falkowbacteria bacterium CG10_big_fil_rev_8_21_14_0_10_43_11]
MLMIARIRLILYSILILILLFLIYQAIVPFGKIIYNVSFCDNSFFISKLKPKERVGEINKLGCTQKIIGEPVYFNLNTQRTFNEAKLTLTYRDDGGNNIIELGLQADKQKNYFLKPLENKIVDSLSWNKIEQDGVVLLQREQKFKSIDEFLINIPPREEILTYQYNLTPRQKIASYSPSTQLTTINQPLRGAYQFYTYVKNEPLDFNLTFSDLNINQGADDVKIVVYYQNKPITEKTLPDARGGEEGRQKTSAGDFNLNLSDLQEGFYKIAVNANDDVITEKISTAQKIASFINRIWLANNNNEGAATLFSDAPEVTISTLNAASLQTVLVNKQELIIPETYRQFSLPTRQNKSEIKIAKSDVIISGAGVFSFADNSLYNPDYKKMTKASDVDAEKVNYIITTYSPAQTTGEWKTKTVSFDLTNAFRYENNYNFMISAPGLIADDGAEDYVEIKNIKIELKGKTLLEKIKENLKFQISNVKSMSKSKI